MEEVDNDHKMAELCSYDCDYAVKVEKEMQDELYAEEIDQREKKEAEKVKAYLEELSKADEKMAYDLQEIVSKEMDHEHKMMRLEII